jgi:tetratricopeptide (TPR) repeat protein
MFRMSLLRGTGLAAALAFLSTAVFAQTAQVEGTVKLKGADGSTKPAAGVLIDIYRIDIKGHFDIKTDKNGHFVRLGLPLQGNYLFVFSGPGATPTWMNNVRISQMPVVDTTLDAGDGRTLTFEEIQKQIAQQKAGGGAPAAKTLSPADKAKAEAAQREMESNAKEGKALQETFDMAVKHFNEGVKLKTANNYEAALSEFEQSTMLDPGKNKNFVEIAHRSNAQVAETHYQLGADKFNKKDRNGAKPHFEQAVTSINKAIAVASAVPDDPSVNNDLITYYSILEKNAQILVENYNEANLVDDTAKSLDKAQTIDTPQNKNKWLVLKAKLYFAAGRSDEAVAVYESVLAGDPNNIDSLFGLGLALVATGEKVQVQKGANTLADFVSKAPANDPRVPIVKEALEGVKNAYKVEAEKPAAQPKRKKP